ncbi:MAG: hypothetical protein DME34_10300 [Verrucomicrobia bacterium]|nr:MAG: hypothetical protein DME34_10300 [Verrucomicrobiota bacterium]
MNVSLSKSRQAFTLVEIMIVVAIIALLAAIAVPGFLRARKRSQASRILNQEGFGALQHRARHPRQRLRPPDGRYVASSSSGQLYCFVRCSWGRLLVAVRAVSNTGPADATTTELPGKLSSTDRSLQTEGHRAI